LDIVMDESLLVVATGSSAAMILTSFLSEIRTQGEEKITVLMTTSAERFVRAEVVGWFADRVLTGDTPGVNPTELALRAKAIVVLPASGNTLASAALGLMSTPALTVLGAAPAPCLWFPHMNPVMWTKPMMQQHVATLRARGEIVVPPIEDSVYEIWRGTRYPGISMPGPDDVAILVRDWLLDRALDAARASAEVALPRARQ
jgi:phosphopantothenoylcysteine synthetase/decarboxylase